MYSGFGLEWVQWGFPESLKGLMEAWGYLLSLGMA